MIKAIYDACVLYSAPLRNLLLRLADAKQVEPFWSEEIHDEWIRSLLRNRPDLIRDNLERTRRKMDSHFSDALVRGYESIIPTLTLPDPNDRHVLAVAIHVKAEYIVTFNLTDFPKSHLRSYGIEAVSPDEVVLRMIQKRPSRIIATVKDHRLSLKRPSKTVSEYLATLEKQGLPQTVVFLREHADEI